MADFSSSLQKGIAAAKRAELNRAEVAAVFKELNEQIGDSTDQKIAIVRGSVLDATTDTLGAGIAALMSNKRVPALLVQSKIEPTRSWQIARWKQDPYGYPCTITLGGDVMHCENRAGLERELSRLLSSPEVGETILAAMNYATAKNPTTEGRLGVLGSSDQAPEAGSTGTS
ncbi:hypothetical protein J2W25_002121 [Variovorax boronicumulans]|uniref:Uncharacterized protein n=1 Tax=Variovorax boronicumulans TaxID=436515 RepID=A0AAW8DU74_9BURK|nr:hypothetical protein [Variovorax boronicumulans]MDP9877816.1 hypothetical protein [Variovorax boronicumulans]MDP9923100.1 hypothetical protein [Variovorax boronicumulans]